MRRPEVADGHAAPVAEAIIHIWEGPAVVEGSGDESAEKLR